MLTITIKAREAWDPKSETFRKLNRDWTLQLEHSLISISKWEAKHHKPYLANEPAKTNDEILDYVRCMTINSNVDPEAYDFLDADNMRAINEYINDPMTATWFSPKPGKSNKSNMPRRETMTNELIYYYMTSYGIDWDAAKWHINRLLTLINVHSEKDSDNPKMSKKDIINRNSALNKARRMATGSKG